MQASSLSAKHAELEASFSDLSIRYAAADSDLAALQVIHSQLSRAHEGQTQELAEAGERLVEGALRLTEAQENIEDLRAEMAALKFQLEQVTPSLPILTCHPSQSIESVLYTLSPASPSAKWLCLMPTD